MGTEGHAGLIEAIQRFLDDAMGARQRILEAIEPSSPRGAVHAMAALPTCVEVNALARKASLAAGYLLPEPAGRPLDADTLVSTGLFRMLIYPSDADLPAVASDLAGYLAGPPVDILDYAIIDVIGALQEPIPVVDGWELVAPGADKLRMLLPLPSTAAYQDRPFNPDDYDELAMLRRVNVGHPERQLWQPLIALSLYDHPLALSLDGNPILRVWAWYRIEPRRRTDTLFESVPRTPDGETDIERLLMGAFCLELAPMQRFLEELSPLLTAALSTQAENKVEKKAKEKAADQLRRCAEQFLTASDAHREGKVSPQQNADAVLHYAMALEVLLGDDDHSDLARKVSQRAAVLAGANDDHRLTVEQLVREAYSARSEYAHGGKRDKSVKVDLAKLRRVVCRCILTRLIVGDPTRLILGDPTRAERLHELADRALLSHDELQSKIRHPFEEFVQRYQAS